MQDIKIINSRIDVRSYSISTGSSSGSEVGGIIGYSDGDINLERVLFDGKIEADLTKLTGLLLQVKSEVLSVEKTTLQ